MWSTYTTEYYLVINKNEIMSFAGKWMELESIMLSKISQTQKDKYHGFSHMWDLDSEGKKDMKVIGLFGKGGWEWTKEGNGGEYHQNTSYTCMQMS
jgi:hypothetical protein